MSDLTPPEVLLDSDPVPATPVGFDTPVAAVSIEEAVANPSTDGAATQDVPPNDPPAEDPTPTEPSSTEPILGAITGVLTKFRDDVIQPLVARIDALELRVHSTEAVIEEPAVTAALETDVEKLTRDVEHSADEIFDAMAKPTPPPAPR